MGSTGKSNSKNDFKYWNVPVLPGIELLGETNLLDALDRNAQEFRTDIKKFFIEAKSHWLNPSLKLPHRANSGKCQVGAAQAPKIKGCRPISGGAQHPQNYEFL